jgi:uncharacterized membrane protein
MYRAHAKAFIAAAAIALVPVYLVHAALAAALLPSAASTSRLEERSERMQRRAAELERRSAAGTLTADEALRAQTDLLRDAGESAADAGMAVAGLGAFILWMLIFVPLSMLGTFFGTAALIPLVQDRAQGGSLTAAQAWTEVGRRAAPLLYTSVLAIAIVLVGLFLLVLPGIVLGFLFAFAAPLVMLAGESGFAALKRSARLVMANAAPTALVLIGWRCSAWSRSPSPGSYCSTARRARRTRRRRPPSRPRPRRTDTRA